MGQQDGFDVLRGHRTLKGVLVTGGASMVVMYGAYVSAASARPRPHASRVAAKPRGSVPQGTIWMQVLNSGVSKEDPAGTQAYPGKSIAANLVRATPSKGLSLRGLACYGVTFDPARNEICFARGRSIPPLRTSSPASDGPDDEPEPRNQNVLYLASANGTNVRLLKRSGVDYAQDIVQDFSPRFMPNGDILFEEGRRIAIMNRTGANVRYLTTSQYQTCGSPSVSRDGRKIAFESNGLNIMDASGKNRVKLLDFTTYYGGEEGNGESQGYTDIELSPDGKRVAYVRNSGETQQVYVLSTVAPASKANPSRQVSGLDKRFKLAEYSNPVWSPDGKFLAVAGGTSESHDIYVLDLATKKMRRLTNTPQDEYPNQWVPSEA